MPCLLLVVVLLGFLLVLSSLLDLFLVLLLLLPLHPREKYSSLVSFLCQVYQPLGVGRSLGIFNSINPVLNLVSVRKVTREDISKTRQRVNDAKNGVACPREAQARSALVPVGTSCSEQGVPARAAQSCILQALIRSNQT